MTKKLIVAMVGVLMMLSGCSTEAKDDKRPILLQGAMDVEVDTMKDALDNMTEVELGKYIFYKGELDGYPVIVSKTNIGLANAAVSTTLAIEEFNPIMIINQGTAGGHSPQLHRMDVVIGEHVVNMGAFKTAYQDLGEGVDPAAFEIRNLEVLRDGKGNAEEKKDFPSDESLIDLAFNLKDKYTEGNVVKGTIGSADEWNNQLDRIKILNEKLGTDAEEMETVSVGQMAYNYDIPYLAIRVLSNTAIHDEDFEPSSAIALQEYVIEITKAYINTIQ